ncbi:MAG TPA: glutathione S-transferase N-terminal domain-containing protein [Brevundimonas sp.]|jgi:glutathione S-transferase|uniref:glutathione S-transferase N-terminal domain-containing protein n=1 Tax=Brevundimonas sp. TaxID=1871086 RepID=UPI002DE59AE6|nr:glutathione S-transferase N-terminal domain-containing protein [Brevundimonas sp.]
MTPRLHITVPSPYARKCRIVAREKGVAIEEVAVDPYASDPRLVAANPVVQVPALETADGVLTDSPVICEWLDVTGAGPLLLPADGAERWRVKRLETLANAGLEMGVKRVLELRRPEQERSASWITRWTENLNRVLDRLEGDPGIAPDLPLDMGRITAGVLVTWAGFRHPDLDWAAGRPRLVALQAALEARPSFADTRPDAP